jgi:hypothetical protein
MTEDLEMDRPNVRGVPRLARMPAYAGSAALLAVVLAMAHTGCGTSDTLDFFVIPFDAGVEAGEAEGGQGEQPEIDPTLGGPCTEDAQCDDLIPCTFDRCDKELSRCRHTPDDAQCSDGVYCNGEEKCVLRRGCVPGPVVTCQDGDYCTIDRCVEETKTCEHVERDSDGDGDPDDHCMSDRDCDDTDPTVSSTRAEVCGNFKDDNCNGLNDEEPCATPANDVCETALEVTAPGTYLLQTTATKRDYTTTCSVRNPSAATDIVLKIQVPPGEAKDVVVRAVTSAPPNDVAVALQTTCGQRATEIGCGHVENANDARAVARSVAPGSAVYAIVTTQRESKVDVRVDMLSASPKPANESCSSPRAVALDEPFTVSLVDPAKDLESACDGATVGELTYSFTLPEPRDVRIFASTLVGNGQPVVSLRSASCTEELRCRTGSTPPVFARSLPAGTHVFSVSGTAQIDANVVVKTFPATPTPPNQTCATAPDLTPNVPFTVDLSGNEDAIKNGCFAGNPNAAYRLQLDQPSDVLVVGRFAPTDSGGISFNNPGCGTSDLLACSTGSGGPIRVSRRNVPPGDYRIVVAGQTGLSAELMVLVRPTVPPVTVTSDDCTNAVVIPEAGGFFTGNTSSANPNFNAGCDAPGQPIGGANDQLLRLDLTQQHRVVFDMIGSSMTTVLDIRSGAACPGVEVPGACAVGAYSSRSFLDLVLKPNTYWVQVDGYAGATGAWNLDVRVLPF